MIHTSAQLKTALASSRCERVATAGSALCYRWSDDLVLNFLVTDEFISVGAEAVVDVAPSPALFEHIARHNLNWSMVAAKVGLRPRTDGQSLTVTVQHSVSPAVTQKELLDTVARIGDLVTEFFGDSFRQEFGGARPGGVWRSGDVSPTSQLQPSTSTGGQPE